MKKMDTGKKRTLIAGAVLVLAVALLAIVFTQLRPAGVSGQKNIEVTVTMRDQSVKTYTIQTEEKFLGDALVAEKLAEGVDGDYGLFITTVAGETIDEEKEEWWCLTKDGQSVQTGVDATPIEDGDHFELTLKVGYGL